MLEAIAERAARGLQFLLPVEEAIGAAELLAERYAATREAVAAGLRCELIPDSGIKSQRSVPGRFRGSARDRTHFLNAAVDVRRRHPHPP